jgi:hypothetical protein
MNMPNRILDPTVRDPGYGKLALIGLCIALLTFAIAKQLPARAAGVGPLAAAAQRQGALLVPNTQSHEQGVGR